MLLYSDYVLDCMPYNKINRECTWQSCSLRKWLNTEFLNEAFTEAERDSLLLTDCFGKGPEKDYAFLLSQNEIVRYFPNETERITTPTAYAVQHGVWTNGHGNCYYWIAGNSMGDAHKVRYVTTAGDFADYVSNSRTRGVRPAVWMKFRTQ